MDISYDYRDLFKVLNKHRVRYLVAGAYAVIFYTEPRFTKDLDIWVDADMQNARKVYEALKEFGAPLVNMSVKDFTDENKVYQIGVAPVRVDIMMGISGIKFKDAWQNRKKSKYAGVPINIIGLRELMETKKQAGRDQDLLDLKGLGSILKQEK